MSLVRPTPPPPALTRSRFSDSWDNSLPPLLPLPRLSLGLSRPETPPSSGIPSMPSTPLSESSSSTPLYPCSPLSAHFSTTSESSPAYITPLPPISLHPTSLFHSDVWGKAAGSEVCVTPVRSNSSSLKIPFKSSSPPPVRGRVISNPRPLRSGPTLTAFEKNQARQTLPSHLKSVSIGKKTIHKEKPRQGIQDYNEAGCWGGMFQCLSGDRYT